MESTEQPDEDVAVEEPARPRRSRRAPVVEEPPAVEYVPPSYLVVVKFDGYEVGDTIPGDDPRIANLFAHGLIG